MRTEQMAYGRRWFEYHCYEGEDSADAELWHRTHQQVTILYREDTGLMDIDRCQYGEPLVYRVRFPDGLEGTVFEDELMASSAEYERPDYVAPLGGDQYIEEAR